MLTAVVAALLALACCVGTQARLGCERQSELAGLHPPCSEQGALHKAFSAATSCKSACVPSNSIAASRATLSASRASGQEAHASRMQNAKLRVSRCRHVHYAKQPHRSLGWVCRAAPAAAARPGAQGSGQLCHAGHSSHSGRDAAPHASAWPRPSQYIGSKQERACRKQSKHQLAREQRHEPRGAGCWARCRHSTARSISACRPIRCCAHHWLLACWSMGRRCTSSACASSERSPCAGKQQMGSPHGARGSSGWPRGEEPDDADCCPKPSRAGRRPRRRPIAHAAPHRRTLAWNHRHQRFPGRQPQRLSGWSACSCAARLSRGRAWSIRGSYVGQSAWHAACHAWQH